MKFVVDNINCEKCAQTIKNSLEDDFGKIGIDLSVNPRILSCDLQNSDKQKFKSELEDLGYKVIKEID
ncbi:heavy metal transport/detoxification protein [Campylobacter fetus]|uniref:heavy metal transport/detoxification protein n=1 Tax=Campylobacter fetus TaxID=196 RepID=UPI003AF47933